MHMWFLGVMSLWLWGTGQALAAPVMIQLTQTACQFIEVEQQDYGFQSKKAEDCVVLISKQKINAWF